MKHRNIIILIISLVIFAPILTFFGYDMYDSWSERIIKTEIYENEEKTLKIDFHHDDTITASLKSKTDMSSLSCGADLVSDNIYVFEGTYDLPNSLYYKFIFYDDYAVVFWNDERVVYYLTDKTD